MTFELGLGVLTIGAGFFAWRFGRRVATRVAAIGVIVLLLAGVGLQLALYYHLSALCYLAAATFAIRNRASVMNLDAALFATMVLTILVVHVVLLAPAAGTTVRLVGALVGQPSVWPYVRIAQLSPIAGLLTAALLGWGLYRFAHRKRMPDYWLLALFGVWAPVFALGLFAWNVPTRYTAISLVPMLFCAFATLQQCIDWLFAEYSRQRKPSSWKPLAATLAALCVVNPVAVAESVNPDYATRPDHKGAADFMRTQRITDQDIVIAEDVLQQTYYLGAVDYWLIGPQVARLYVKRTDAGIVDFYTGTPVIVTTAMLDELLRNNSGKRIFIVGSGEDWKGGRRLVREDLEAALHSGRFETVYAGRDGRTRVLRAVPNAAKFATGVPDTSDVRTPHRKGVAVRRPDMELPQAHKPATSLDVP